MEKNGNIERATSSVAIAIGVTLKLPENIDANIGTLAMPRNQINTAAMNDWSLVRRHCSVE